VNFKMSKLLKNIVLIRKNYFLNSCRRISGTADNRIEDVISDVRGRLADGRTEFFHSQIIHLSTYLQEEKPCDQTGEAAQLLMQACSSDIIDVPKIKSQQTITTDSWNTIKNVVFLEPKTAKLYNSALDAFIFQNIKIDEENFLSEMLEVCPSDDDTHSKLVVSTCRKGDLTKALELANRFNIRSVEATLELITAHVEKAQIKEAECLLADIELDKDSLLRFPEVSIDVWLRMRAAGAFLIGAARSGDKELIRQYLDTYFIGLKETVSGLVEVCRSHPEQRTTFLNSIDIAGQEQHDRRKEKWLNNEARRSEYGEYDDNPSQQNVSRGNRSFEVYNSRLKHIVGRPVKELLDLELVDVAVDLLALTREHKNIKNFSSMRIQPAAIVVDHCIQNSWAKLKSGHAASVADLHLDKLEEYDQDIKAKTISLMYEYLLENPKSLQFCRDICLSAQPNNKYSKKVTEMFLNKCILNKAEILEKTQDLKTDKPLVNLIKTASQLGFRVDHVPVWHRVLTILIPDKPQTVSGDYDLKTLVARTWEVRDLVQCLVSKEKGFYSNSVVWGHIMETLLHRESEIFFYTAAILSKKLGVLYAPTRWYVHLGRALYSTRLTSTYVDILKVSHTTFTKKEAYRDQYFIICESILKTVERAEEEKANIDDMLSEIFTLAWNRGMLFPRRVLTSACASIQDRDLAEQVLKIPSLEEKEGVLKGRKSKMSFVEKMITDEEKSKTR